MDAVLLAPGIGDKRIAGGQGHAARSFTEPRFDIPEGIFSPGIAAPVQESVEPVTEVEPLQQARLEQRFIDESVEIPAAGQETGIKPSLPALSDMGVNLIHVFVEGAQL